MAQALEPALIVVPEDTPNPSSTRFAVNRALTKPPGRDFISVEYASESPLACELFLLPGVRSVYIGENFVTVSVNPGTDWWSLRPMVVQCIESFIAGGQSAIQESGQSAPPRPPEAPLTGIELRIRQVLENEIQPAVAMDGGYIGFVAYEKGVVKLQLRGACHSCPSSMVTLRVGIENRLKQEIPEIVSVEAV